MTAPGRSAPSSLTVPRGSLVGLLGPNGAGKTTAMLMLATLLAPTRGIARIFGLDTRTQRSTIRRRLGLVFQETSVDGFLTVEENLLFAARLAGLSGGAARVAVAAAISGAGLAPRASQPARQLSGGWRRLVDIARATMHRPDLLILDEPTVGLDPEHRERIWAILDAERRRHGHDHPLLDALSHRGRARRPRGPSRPRRCRRRRTAIGASSGNG